MTRNGVVIRSLEAGDSINNSELTEEYGKVEKMANLACVTSVTVIMLEKVFRQASPSFK